MKNYFFGTIKTWSWKKKIIGIIILFSILGLFWQLSTKKVESNITVMPAVKTDSSVVAQGSVIPIHYSALSLPTAGIVSEVLVAEGDHVSKGQTLVRFTNGDLVAKANASNADTARAQARHEENLNGSRAQEIAMKKSAVDETTAIYNMAKANWERIQNIGDAISKRDYETYRKDYLKSLADMENAQAGYDMVRSGVRPEQIKASTAEVTAAKANYDYAVSLVNQTELQAPFDGTITYLDCRVGERVAPDKVMVQLGDVSEWLIKTDDLTELQVAKVQKGATVRMKFDALPGVEILGKVVSIRPFGEKKQGDITYTVLIKPDSFEPRLQWNMTATVSIDANL